MTDFSEKLSAYLDGELGVDETEMVEARLASDPDAQAELDALMDADAFLQAAFEEELNDPVPFDLAKQIKAADLPDAVVNTPRPLRGLIAASLFFLAVGGVSGYALKQQATPVQTVGWLADIADYHAVYAKQGRHLVEVSADEADHIEAWLGKTTGAEFSIPDLAKFGLTFEGGRLLVANGKPVAQLMYRQADGTVIALCLQDSSKPVTDTVTFKDQTINGFDFVSWSDNGADYVVIGPTGTPDLSDIAAQAAIDI